MIAVKGNVEYTITDTEKSYYIKSGFDILDETGNKIAEGAHKMVSYEKYKELEERYDKLKAEKNDTKEVENLKAVIKEIEKSKNDVLAENEKLNAEITKLQEEKKAKK